MRDHPRRCGENMPSIHSSPHVPGSPPQVRGKHYRFGRCVRGCRITPAGAGKTIAQFAKCIQKEDHPRRCGENKEAQAIKVLRTGSPPQVRGKHSDMLDGINAVRITPAGAGKTWIDAKPSEPAEDHPRRCGENITANLFTLTVRGSPPQVRGKPAKS